MAQTEPCWTEAVEAAEAFADLQRRNRADGEVSVEEAQHEAETFRTVLFPAVMNTADCLEYAQAAMRRGPEAPRATRLRNDRMKRLANLIAFPQSGSPEAA